MRKSDFAYSAFPPPGRWMERRGERSRTVFSANHRDTYVISSVIASRIYPVAGVCSCNHENSNLDSQFGISLGIHMVAGANSCNGSKKNGMVKLLKPIPFHLIVILFDLRGKDYSQHTAFHFSLFTFHFSLKHLRERISHSLR